MIENMVKNKENYKRTNKKKYVITVYRPPMGTCVYNVLEDVNYVTDEKKQFVLEGTAGELWVIDSGKLQKTYTLTDGSPLTLGYLKSHMTDKGIKIKTTTGVTNWAMFVPMQYQVQVPTSWGDVLTANRPGIPHGAGDFIVCADNNGQPNFKDKWVVNGAIFRDTYDMRGFKNM